MVLNRNGFDIEDAYLHIFKMLSFMVHVNQRVILFSSLLNAILQPEISEDWVDFNVNPYLVAV